ncbi:CBL-interacting serine/threonine-protein kinase 7 [Dionaea muscipula]
MDPVAAPPSSPSSSSSTAAAATTNNNNITSAAAAPTILGRYQLGGLLGRGSFAKVYYGRSLADNAAVAIKVIDKSKTNASMEPRIIQEVAAMRRLNHPNVLRIHEVMATKAKIYLVMELARGGDLFEKLARRQGHRFPEPYARRLFHQLVSALQYCHQNGVAHRDMKPQNVLLDVDGNVKISDFGLSAVVVQHQGGLLHLHTACGTPAFAAPEVVSRRGYDGTKADAWSCGVILFVMLSGSLPFDDSNLVAMYRKMYRRDLQFPPWISRPGRALIFQLLDPNPSSRLSVEAIAQSTWLRSAQFGSRSLSLGDLVSLNERKFERVSSMNAFDIISMSSGLDLSGLFDDVGSKERRFTTREDAGKVVEKVVEVGGKLGYEVERGKAGKIWLGKGRLLLIVEILEVAAGMLVGEMKVVDGGGGAGLEELQWGELKSELGDIVLQWQNEEGT